MELTEDNEKALKYVIHQLIKEKNPCCNIKIIDAQYIVNNILYIPLPIVLLQIICEYANDVFELKISSVCRIDKYYEHLPLHFEELRFEMKIDILDVCELYLNIFISSDMIMNYDVYIMRISPDILKCVYHCSNKNKLEKTIEKMNELPHDDILSCCKAQYFFNAYMKQLHNYDDYLGVFDEQYHSCEYKNGKYIRVDKYPTKEYYILQPMNHDMITNIIIMTRMIAQKLKTIIGEFVDSEVLSTIQYSYS